MGLRLQLNPKNMYRLARQLLALILAVASTASFSLAELHTAQEPEAPSPTDRVELYQALLDLTNPWTVMCVAAHPDDEDGVTLTVLRHKYGVHTVSVFSTYGEGGQNAIGPELYKELGVIRARETMAAAEIQGSEPYFLGLRDFGYSKSAEEAFRVWGHDEALRRMVLKIRQLRPDVVITNHDTTSGHGHHQATGRLLLEAFDAAADPKRFPEQLRDGVQPWQAQRLFVRVNYEGGRFDKLKAVELEEAERAGKIVTVDPNESDTIRGTTYAEQALQALQKHATQGPWPKTMADWVRLLNQQTETSQRIDVEKTTASPATVPPIRYRLVRETNGAASLPANSHNFLDGLRLPEEVAEQLQPPTIDGRSLTDFIDQRERVLSVLVAAAKGKFFNQARDFVTEEDDSTINGRRTKMLRRLYRALAVASGISTSLIASDEALVPGVLTTFALTISNTGKAEARVGLVAFGVGDRERHVALFADQVVNSSIAPGKTIRIPLNYQTPRNANITVPHSDHLYDGNFVGKPVAAGILVETGGAALPPIIAHTFLDVAPAVEIAGLNPSPLVVTSTKTLPPPTGRRISLTPTFTFAVQLINHQNSAFEGELVAESPANNRAKSLAVKLPPLGSEIVKMTVERVITTTDFGRRGAKPLPNVLTFNVTRSSSREAVAKRAVPIVYADAHFAPNLNVGYIHGFDYSLPNVLAALGVESKELTIEDVRGGDLKRYDTIILDNRVYQSHPELIALNQHLLDYVKDGGTLIVFYQRAAEWNPDPEKKRPQLAPYPIILGSERITDENSPVTFTEPQHPLLSSPNKIGPEDFKGWIQERGLYYPKEWDTQYTGLLQTNDPGELPLRGGLLVADYGRGHYIYTSMVWYRQLRAGVPGAYRVLANMISYGRQ